MSPNLSFPGIQRRIVGCDMLRHAATCCDMFFMSFFSLVKTGVHHILQDMDVTGAGALRSTISRPSENDDGEREKEREREIMKRDSTCGDIWRHMATKFIYIHNG